MFAVKFSCENSHNTQEQFGVYERKGQLVLALNSEKMIPENAAVRLVSAVFADGTKLESNAGRYTFVWRKNVEKHLAGVKEQVCKETGMTSLKSF